MENIMRILNSEIGLHEEKVEGRNEYNVVDNRFMLLKSMVDFVDNKDDAFYADLITTMSEYIDTLYDSRIEKPEDYKGIVFDNNGKMLLQEKDFTRCEDDFVCLKTFSHRANVDLVRNLFDYTCDILERNKDVVLDVSTLSRLLNRNPKRLSMSIDMDYVYRGLDFTRLAKIVKQNEMLDKANISTGDVYQLLIDTCQLNNEFVVPHLVSSDDFKNNHSKIDEILKTCGAWNFVNITNIIVKYLDEDFDRLSYVREKQNEIFSGYVIFHSLKSDCEEKDYELVHEILTDNDIEVDYTVSLSDYLGGYNLREFIAFYGNKQVLSDFLSNENNVRTTYWYGNKVIDLFNLYAKIGEYEKALTAFNSIYCYGCDYRGSLDDNGYAFGWLLHRDSLVDFVGDMCKSFEEEEVPFDDRSNLINSILINDNVPYINLNSVLPVVKNVLFDEDYQMLSNKLEEKYSNGNLKFTVVEEQKDPTARVRIRIATDEEVSRTFSSFATKEENKVLNKNMNN